MNKLPIISNYSKVSKTIEKDTFQPLGQYPTDEKFQLSFRYFEQQQFSVCPLWIFITTWGILWMIFSTRLKSAFMCHNKFLWRECLFSVMVGASKAGLLSIKDTCLVTISVSSFLMLKIFTIITGMYSNFFLMVIIFTSQSFVCWLYNSIQFNSILYSPYTRYLQKCT